MIRLHLVRHGQCEVPADGGMLGQRDVPLTELGVRQALAAGERLRDVPFVAAITSDLRRARDTAELALGERGVPLLVEPRLREFDIGAWEGLAWDGVEARYPGSMEAFTAPHPGLAFPSGESLAGIAERVCAALDDVRRDTPEGDVLVVGHQGSLTVLLARALGLPEWGWSRFILGFASITTLEFHPTTGSERGNDTPLLVAFNDRAHLAEVGDGHR